MESSNEPLFSWLHLSDIHFGHGSAAERAHRELVLNQFERDYLKAKDWGAPSPEAVLVTGDIGFSGDALGRQEYSQASSWLLRLTDQLHLKSHNIYLVPGNHDAPRLKEPGEVEKLEEIRSGTRRLDDVLDDAPVRELLAGRMKPYREMAAQLNPHAGSGAPQDALCWVHALTARSGLPVRLMGLNTAILANDDQDKGKLWMGRRQLVRAFKDSTPDELLIALAHHPLGWLGDGAEVALWLESRADIFLSGHLHELESVSTQRSGGRRFVHVASGALHEVPAPKEKPVPFGFNFGAVYAGPHGKLQLRIWPFIWTKHHEFLPDSAHLREPMKYYATHDLEGATPAQAQGGASAADRVEPRPQRQPGGPLRTDDPAYIPRRSDDEALGIAQQQAETLVIKAPLQMGKSSLLGRYLEECRQSGKRTVQLDFLMFEERVLRDYPSLLNFLAAEILRALELPPELKPEIGSHQEMCHFIEDRVLQAVQEPLVLAFDQVDRVLGRPYQEDLFYLFRYWHNKRSADALARWARLGIALVISTEPYLLISDAHRSPFSVVSAIKLQPFGTRECLEFNRRYGDFLKPEQVEELHRLLGGNPHLMHVAYYLMTGRGRVKFDELKQKAHEDGGPFRDHLRGLRKQLTQGGTIRLLEAMKQIIEYGTVPDEDAFQRLSGAGLCQREEGRIRASCELYVRAFGGAR
ncbi:AAA-like domain-containing protein [Hyalangium versicolor]|uniref:AAA-like domain-containing protein n=1 Tax=Hyalangium versicolor TaxID=2861190 RepID=UPI001CCEBB09|nr:AAA-like domain-containing protein [Hyalangium versicolor]